MQMSSTGRTVPLEAVLWRKPSEIPRWSETAVLLAQPWAHNWHHWLLDSLPRLMVIADWPELAALPVIVPGPLTEPQADALRALGIDESRWRCLTGEAHEVETLILPQPGGFAPDVLQRLRGALASPRTRGGSSRLYVSRHDAPSRRVANEADLLAVLQPLGFRSLTLTGMSLAEQRKTFADAQVIVGPHGAGLTNSLFAPEGATVVELHPRDTANGCFRLTTAAWGQQHVFLSGRVVNAQTRDFTVDPDLVRAVVESLRLGS